jgi:single-strand DNA-binding protein
MNKLTIIGNLTRDPELRTTQSGLQVANFTVAVNRRRQQSGETEADFFVVTAWRELGVNCAKFLRKGRKVCVVGPVCLHTWQDMDGTGHATLGVTAAEVEFLGSQSRLDPESGMETVDDNDLPF